MFAGRRRRPEITASSVGTTATWDGRPPGTLQPAEIAAEAGVGSVADSGALAALGSAVRWLRILVEVSGVPAARAVAVADEILRSLDQLGLAVPRLLHGEEDSCWPLVRRAGELGLATRIGLEDTLTGPDGRLAGGHAGLVRLALATWTAAAAP